MTDRVLHFGWDDCYRVRVLRSAGYTVEEAPILDALELDLQREPFDAVILSEESPRCAEDAADLVRQRSLVPVILFRRSLHNLNERKFDHVFEWTAKPSEWLNRTAELIANNRTLHAESARLQIEAPAASEHTQRERERRSLIRRYFRTNKRA